MLIDLAGYQPADAFYSHGFDRKCSIFRDWVSPAEEVAVNVPCTVARHRVTLQSAEGDIVIPSLTTFVVFIACVYQKLDENGNLQQIVFSDQECPEVREETWYDDKKKYIRTVHIMTGDIVFVEGVWHALRIRQIYNPLFWHWHLELTCVPDVAKHDKVPHLDGNTSTIPPLIPFP